MIKRYCISRFYRSRTEYHHFDDSPFRDEWQLEVYLYALGLMKKHGFQSVVDIGCGSAYKLLTYLGEYDTIGMELPANVKMLQEKHPGRTWRTSDFSVHENLSTDVVICSDVIEHLVDPDELIDFIKSISFRFLVLSTPDRSLFYRPWQRKFWGPPGNKSHQREWTFREFREYVSASFNVIDHRITNVPQGTQMIVCSSPSSGDNAPQ